LPHWGITSLSLTSDGVSSSPTNGVTVHGQTTAALTDGSHMLVADVSFAYTQLMNEQAMTEANHAVI